MGLVETILPTLPDGQITRVVAGDHWTAVVVDAGECPQCGLASTLEKRTFSDYGAAEAYGDLVGLVGTSAKSLVRRLLADDSHYWSAAVAAMNALIKPTPEVWHDGNAEEQIAQAGAGKNVALVGHFYFVDRLREKVGRLDVLDLEPGPDDLPAEAAPDVIPPADVVAITSMTILNRTADYLLSLCRPEATVILLGPSSPLSPVLHDLGVNVISGSVVTDISPVLDAVEDGFSLRALKHRAVRQVSLIRDVET